MHNVSFRLFPPPPELFKSKACLMAILMYIQSSVGSRRQVKSPSVNSRTALEIDMLVFIKNLRQVLLTQTI